MSLPINPDVVRDAAEQANKLFGQWMPEKWVNLFIDSYDDIVATRWGLTNTVADVDLKERVAINLWHRFAPESHEEWSEETHSAEYRDAADAILFLIRGVAKSSQVTEKTASDAPFHLNAGEADAWACGYNAALAAQQVETLTAEQWVDKLREGTEFAETPFSRSELMTRDGETKTVETQTVAGRHLADLILEYARDLRRNSSGGDNYPWEYAKGTADYLEELVRRVHIIALAQPTRYLVRNDQGSTGFEIIDIDKGKWVATFSTKDAADRCASALAAQPPAAPVEPLASALQHLNDLGERALLYAQSMPAAPVETDVDAGAKRLAKWIGYLWEGLNDGRIGDRGYQQWSFNGIGQKQFQGGKDDLRDLAREIVALYRSSAETEQLKQVLRDIREQLIKARDALGRGHELEVECSRHIGRAWHALNGTGVAS